MRTFAEFIHWICSFTDTRERGCRVKIVVCYPIHRKLYKTSRIYVHSLISGGEHRKIQGWSSRYILNLVVTLITADGYFGKSQKPSVMDDNDNEVWLCCICLRGLVFCKDSQFCRQFCFHFRLFSYWASDFTSNCHKPNNRRCGFCCHLLEEKRQKTGLVAEYYDLHIIIFKLNTTVRFVCLLDHFQFVCSWNIIQLPDMTCSTALLCSGRLRSDVKFV